MNDQIAAIVAVGLLMGAVCILVWHAERLHKKLMIAYRIILQDDEDIRRAAEVIANLGSHMKEIVEITLLDGPSEEGTIHLTEQVIQDTKREIERLVAIADHDIN
jgi:hypothetical protein